MKKVMSGLFALVLALGALAFTEDAAAPKADYYWFRLNADGSSQSVTTMPTLQSSDPYGCTTGAANCAQGFSSYTTNATVPVTYSASGTAGPIHKKS